MALPDDLRKQAWHLAHRERTRPTQASLRRAVSTGYYALFHLLIEDATVVMFGRRPNRRPFRNLLSRAFSHQSMVQTCKAFQASTLPPKIAATVGAMSIPADLQSVAAAFVKLQEARHRADYDLATPFQKGDVIPLLQQLDDAFECWRRIRSQESARLFLMVLPLWRELQR